MPPPPPLPLSLSLLLPYLSLSLILKVAATSLSGAAAFVACRNMLRNEALQTQLHHIRASRRRLRRPPTIYLLGFKGRGKSAFLNTACRVLGEEVGQLVFRSNTAPMGPTRTTAEITVVQLADPDEEEEGRLVTLVDTPGLPLGSLKRADIEKVLPATGGQLPDCVVVVLRCSDVLRSFSEMRLAEIVAVMRDRGWSLSLLLTRFDFCRLGFW